MREWHEKYADDGFVIIGVHTPEFRHERDVNNVENSLVRLSIPFAVAIDNDWKTWRSYNNRYWPAMYFIDKSGQIRYLKIGEGQYSYSESVIQALLAEPYTAN